VIFIKKAGRLAVILRNLEIADVAANYGKQLDLALKVAKNMKL